MPSLIVTWWNRRRLVGKQLTLLLYALLATLPIAYFVLGGLLRPAFDHIEQQQVSDQKARISHSLREFEHRVLNATLDYAVWDDMYNYVEHPNRAFEAQTLTPVSHMNNGLDYRGIVNSSGTVVWSSAVNLKSATVMKPESEAMKAVLTDPAFLKRANAKTSTVTYRRTPQGIYLLASARIIRSDESGTPRGFIVNGILLNGKSLSEALQVSVTVSNGLSPAEQQRLAGAPDHSRSKVERRLIMTQVGLVGADGKLLTSINFSTPRDVSAVGQEAINSAALVLLIVALGLVALLTFGLRHIMVTRIQELEAYVRNFSVDGHALHPRLTTGADEIASLSKEFQALSEKLGIAEEQLRQRSYLQGKADSAAGMLHNVRNALAPIRIMQEKWLAEESLPFRINLKRAAEEVANDQIDPARKASLEQFMLSAARQIALTGDGRLHEMESTKSSIDQIAEILGSYDFDTSDRRSGEPIELAALLAREAKTVAAGESGGFVLETPENLPRVEGNRVQLGQVIGNIFVNADEAMTAAQANPKRLVVSIAVGPEPELVQLRFTDNGDGISPENIEKAFQRGYSTREHKAGGLGMHWSANAMRAMGGSIALESEGPGKGATAVLTLRCAPTAQAELKAA